MPAKSKDQATAAKIALQIKKGKQKAKSGTASAQMAKNMTKKQLRDFTKKESLKLVDDVMVEHGGQMFTIKAGTIFETVGTGAVAMIPTALGSDKEDYDDDEDDDEEEEEVEEASNSQMSELNLDY